MSTDKLHDLQFDTLGVQGSVSSISENPKFRVTYIHLGLPKTGTTTIQASLFRQRHKLSELGVLYPGFSENHTTPLHSIFGENPHHLPENILRGAATAETASAIATSWSQKLDEALAAPDWRKLVLSAEGVSHLPAERLITLRDRLLKSSDQVIVLLCLRHPFMQRVSLIQQSLKTGGTIDDEVRRHSARNYYRGTVRRICSAFGSENVRISIFEEMQNHPDGLVGAFATQIGLSFTDLTMNHRKQMNQRMSQHACLMLDRLNQDVPLFVDGHKNTNRSRNVDRLIRRIPGTRFCLTPEQADLLRDAVDDDISFTNEFLGRQAWLESLPAQSCAPKQSKASNLTFFLVKLVSRIMP